MKFGKRFHSRKGQHSRRPDALPAHSFAPSNAIAHELRDPVYAHRREQQLSSKPQRRSKRQLASGLRIRPTPIDYTPVRKLNNVALARTASIVPQFRPAAFVILQTHPLLPRWICPSMERTQLAKSCLSFG
ncbi:hypothetical protein RB3864 [Rhodopirellula baltica SH 1]|uniref:Uncharacterized protein n=1 Tax=Rhodopirellula baltica (strain DSM 10527 / NCIMB 13988 / SH1) TaxID=243090 RepID=Q7UTI5_RHOBA|nr:hypothetical protein RB3864 [Rhodopirellula baltica SH 1]